MSAKYLVNFYQSDHKYKLKYQAYKACYEAGVEAPKELDDLFDCVKPEFIVPDAKPLQSVDVESWDDEIGEHCSAHCLEKIGGRLRIRVKDLPDNVDYIEMRVDY